MKILVITDKLYPDEYGGSCTVAYETIKEWQKTECVDIYTCSSTKTSNDKLFTGNIYRNLNKKRLLKSAKKLSQIMKNTYDIVVFHSVIAWFIYYISKMFGNYHGVKEIAVFHGPWHKEAYYKYEGNGNIIKAKTLPILMLIIEKLYVSKNENFIVLSEYMKNELTKINKNIKKKQVDIIPGGVDLENFHRKYSKKEAKRKLGINENKIVLFILRRLDKRMGIDNAIRAVGAIPETIRDDYILLIGGKGKYLTQLKKVSSEVKANIVFKGFIPDEEVNLYFCATDLFIVPTMNLEGFGLVNLESLAMGVPVLANPQGGMIDLSDKFENFHLCKDMEIKSMKESIIKLSTKYKNKTIEEQIIEHYSWNNISQIYLKKFKEILKYAKD